MPQKRPEFAQFVAFGKIDALWCGETHFRRSIYNSRMVHMFLPQATWRLAITSCSVFALTMIASVPLQAHAMAVNFNSLGYAGDCKNDPSLWSGSSTEIKNHEGIFFGGLFPLDIADYQSKCWNMYGKGAPLNGYVDGEGKPLAPVVGLLRWPGFIQLSDGGAFKLESMAVGAGWTTTTLNFRGYTSTNTDEPATFKESFSIAPSGLTTLSFIDWFDLRYLKINATYDDNDVHNITARTDEPVYQTAFISGITVTPVSEPATVVLMGMGLAVVAMVGRRRRIHPA